MTAPTDVPSDRPTVAPDRPTVEPAEAVEPAAKRPTGQPRRGTAANPAPPTVCRMRVRFAKRGRLRFGSHRDVARSFERAVRRAGVPVSHSQGFNPRPRMSWVGAAPTGAASEAEYLEIGLIREVSPDRVAAALDAALPPGLDVLDAILVPLGETSLADLIDGSRWRIELPGVATAELAGAVAALLAEESLTVPRSTKSGPKPVDVRAAMITAEVLAGDGPRSLTDQRECAGSAPESATSDAGGRSCAIMTTVVRQTTPAVRPDDVLAALRVVAGLSLPVPAVSTRLVQGLLDDRGRLADPFGAARVTTPTAPEGSGARSVPAVGDQRGVAG